MAEHAEAMVERNDDHIATLRQAFTIVGAQFLAGAGDEATAVQPDHDRALFVVVDAAGPDIHSETIFVGHAVIPGKHPGIFVVGPALTKYLRADPAELHRAANTGPRRGLAGREKAGFATGRRTVRNAFKGVGPIVHIAAHFSRSGFDHGS